LCALYFIDDSSIFRWTSIESGHGSLRAPLIWRGVSLSPDSMAGTDEGVGIGQTAHSHPD
jgi:hypothetical protein